MRYVIQLSTLNPLSKVMSLFLKKEELSSPVVHVDLIDSNEDALIPKYRVFFRKTIEFYPPFNRLMFGRWDFEVEGHCRDGAVLTREFSIYGKHPQEKVVNMLKEKIMDKDFFNVLAA